MPLAWKEVKPGLSPAAFNLSNYKKRLAGADAWEGFFESRQSLKGRS
jgi:DNA primase